jgi:hypothetical protein
VRREVRAQVERARSAGIRPTHLITDMGAMLTRADLVDIYLNTAEKYWIPAVMVELTPQMVLRFRSEGFDLTPDILARVGRYGLPKLDDIDSIPAAVSYEAKRERFYNLVRNLPAGITQIVARPADDTKALKQITPGWQDSVWEAQLFRDTEVQEFLDDQNIVFTNWREMMDRFERGHRGAEVSGASAEREKP